MDVQFLGTVLSMVIKNLRNSITRWRRWRSEIRESAVAGGCGDSPRSNNFLRGRARPPKPLIMGFIDTLRAEGYAVESICRVLREQGCQIAAWPYRAWRAGRQPSARTVSDAMVINAILDARFTTDPDGQGRLTPEGLYGRRKMTAYLRRNGFPDVAACTVDRCMRILSIIGLSKSDTNRSREPRSSAPTCSV